MTPINQMNNNTAPKCVDGGIAWSTPCQNQDTDKDKQSTDKKAQGDGFFQQQGRQRDSNNDTHAVYHRNSRQRGNRNGFEVQYPIHGSRDTCPNEPSPCLLRYGFDVFQTITPRAWHKTMRNKTPVRMTKATYSLACPMPIFENTTATPAMSVPKRV